MHIGVADLAVAVPVLELEVSGPGVGLILIAFAVHVILDLVSALENAHRIIISGADRVADLESVVRIETVSHGVGHVIRLIAFIIGTEEGDELVGIGIENYIAFPTEGVTAVAVDVDSIQDKLNTFVRDLTDIVIYAAET